jgi:hypothetical protein
VATLADLSRPVVISLLSHLTVFSIFGFSFGNTLPKPTYSQVCFYGQLLGRAELPQPANLTASQNKNNLVVLGNPPLNLTRLTQNSTYLQLELAKPALFLAGAQEEKEIFHRQPYQLAHLVQRKEPVLVFHPSLPYSLSLYFKDRQVAHVELMFKIERSGAKTNILIKRKISSGNLEVDLLVMRYIGHYLFIRQAGIPQGPWQTVKIDLSTKND